MKLNNINVEILEEIEFKPLKIGSQEKTYYQDSCIYCIYNKSNGKYYIGSCLKFRNRIKNHRKDLKQQIHHSQHFQRAFNKYGINNFKVLILEKVTRENKIEREQYWLDLLTPYNNIGYNISKTAQKAMLGITMSQESKDKIAFKNGKRILQIDLKGNIINKFKSTAEVSRVLPITQGAISLSARSNYITQNCIWLYEDELLKNKEAINNKLLLVKERLLKVSKYRKSFGKRSIITIFKNI